MIDVCLLGCGGMFPLENRWLSSLLIRHNGKLTLFDCGEGTQIAFKLASWGFKSLDTIFFTHYHADHISGLPGFLLTLGNSHKDTPLKIYGPPGLKKIIEGLTVICPELPYTLELYELSKNEISKVQVNDLLVKSLPVDHRITCFSYNIFLKRKGVFDIEKAKKLNIPINYWKVLQSEKEVYYNNKLFTPNMVLGKERKGIKVSFCTDTRPSQSIIEFVKESDLFFCEGNYNCESKLEKAKEKKHMLFSEAATMAKKANVKKLILTHFSPAINDPYITLHDTRNIFSNTFIGNNLMKFKTNYPE